MAGHCTRCGAAIIDGAAFCAGCGTAVAGATMGSYSSYEPRAYTHGSFGAASGNVEPLQAMFIPFKRYADFKGRSSRNEYWMFTLLYWAVMIFGFVLVGVGGAMDGNKRGGDVPLLGGIGIAIVILWWLVTIIPGLALDVRRLHDQDKTGALVILFILLGFMFSFIGWIVQVIFMCIDGTPGPNKYGPDPKSWGNAADVFD